jgi:hypothetical protein
MANRIASKTIPGLTMTHLLGRYSTSNLSKSAKAIGDGVREMVRTGAQPQAAQCLQQGLFARIINHLRR